MVPFFNLGPAKIYCHFVVSSRKNRTLFKKLFSINAKSSLGCSLPSITSIIYLFIGWHMSKTFVAQFDDFVAFNSGLCWSCVGIQYFKKELSYKYKKITNIVSFYQIYLIFFYIWVQNCECCVTGG